MHIIFKADTLPNNTDDFYRLWNPTWFLWLSWWRSLSSLFIIPGFNRNHRLEEGTVTALSVESANAQGRLQSCEWFRETVEWSGKKMSFETRPKFKSCSSPFSWAGQRGHSLVISSVLIIHGISFYRFASLSKFVCDPQISTHDASQSFPDRWKWTKCFNWSIVNLQYSISS